jgi:hypothetical protein
VDILAVDPGGKYGMATYVEGLVEIFQGTMRGRSPSDKKRRLLLDILLNFDGRAFDLLLVERPLPPGPGRSLVGTISLAMTSGVFIGCLDSHELEILTPSQWNSRGTGQARATRCLNKFRVTPPGEDAKSALGMLLWKLEDIEEEISGIRSGELLTVPSRSTRLDRV